MEPLLRAVGGLLVDPQYADLHIKCCGETFKVHRAIMCPRSAALASECNGGFQETNTRVIEHATFDALMVSRMPQFLYTSEYEGGGLAPTSKSSPSSTNLQSGTLPKVEEAEKSPSNTPTALEDILIGHTLVFAIADYYDIEDLRLLALQKFTHARKNSKLVETHRLSGVARAIYGNTPPLETRLRGKLLAMAHDYVIELLADSRFMKAVSLEDDLRIFIADVFAASTKQNAQERRDQLNAERAIAQAALLLSQRCEVSIALLEGELAAQTIDLDALQLKRNSAAVAEKFMKDTSKAIQAHACKTRTITPRGYTVKRQAQAGFGSRGYNLVVACADCNTLTVTLPCP